jgi:hypothetical protein
VGSAVLKGLERPSRSPARAAGVFGFGSILERAREPDRKSRRVLATRGIEIEPMTIAARELLAASYAKGHDEVVPRTLDTNFWRAAVGTARGGRNRGASAPRTGAAAGVLAFWMLSMFVVRRRRYCERP